MSEPSAMSVKQRPASIVYFKQQSGNAMKRLATRIRDQGADCHLVWSHLFVGPESIIGHAKAVVIEVGSPRAVTIERAYRQFSHDVEIHYVNSEGAFVDAPAQKADNQPRRDDPNAAIQNLRTKADARKESGASKATEPVAKDRADDIPATDRPSGAGDGSGQTDPS